jgi:Flp pilus assembly protein TadB
MLDDRERRILADIEQGLIEHDPELVASLERPERFLHPPWWPFVCAVVGLAVAVFLVTLGLVGNALLLLALACIPLAPRWVRYVRARRRLATPPDRPRG